MQNGRWDVKVMVLRVLSVTSTCMFFNVGVCMHPCIPLVWCHAHPSMIYLINGVFVYIVYAFKIIFYLITIKFIFYNYFFKNFNVLI